MAELEQGTPAEIARPTAAPLKPTENIWGFHQAERKLTVLPVPRYCSGQEKKWFEFPIQFFRWENLDERATLKVDHGENSALGLEIELNSPSIDLW